MSNESSAINITKLDWSLQDDIVFNNIGLCLYATGCAWKCPGCHSKELWDFNHPESSKITAEELINYINKRIYAVPRKELTIVFMGGDFWFQKETFLEFCKQLKEALPEVKILWYTGAEFEDRDKLPEDVDIDAILWGRLKNNNGKVIKKLSKLNDKHKSFKGVKVNDYDASYE